MTNPDSKAISKFAAHIGVCFAEHYYAVLRTTPEFASDFYHETGVYQTVYEDGTSVIARTRPEVKSILFRRISASDLTVKSIFSIPCHGSLDHLLITVIGNSFMHVFNAEYHSKRTIAYTIVASFTHYTSAAPATNRPPAPVTAFTTGNCYADASDKLESSTASFTSRKGVCYSPIMTTYQKPLPYPVTINTQLHIAAANPPNKILKRKLNVIEIGTSREPLPDTVTDKRPSVGLKPKKRVDVSSNNPTLPEPLHGIITDNMLTTGLKAGTHKIQHSSESSDTMTYLDPKTISENVAHIGACFAENYYAELCTTPEFASDFYHETGVYQTVYEDGTSVIARTRPEVKSILLRRISASDLTVKSTFSIPYRGSLDQMLIVVIGNSFTHVFNVEYYSKRTIAYNIVASFTYYTSAAPATNLPPTPVTAFTTGDCYADASDKVESPTASFTSKKGVCYSPIMNTYQKLLPDPVNINTQLYIATVNPPNKFLKRGLNPIENGTLREPFSDPVTINTKPHIAAAIPPNKILKRGLNPIEKGTLREPFSDPVTINTKPHIAAAIPPNKFLKRGLNPIEKGTLREPFSDPVTINTKPHIAAAIPPNKILKRKLNAIEIGTSREPVPDIVTDKRPTAGLIPKKRLRVTPNKPTPREPLPGNIAYNKPTAGLKPKKLLPVSSNKPIPREPLHGTVTNNRPSAVLKPKKRVDVSSNKLTPREPLHGTVINNTPSVGLKPKKRVDVSSNNPTPLKPLHGIIVDNRSTAGLRPKKHVRFLPNISTTREFISDFIIDNAPTAVSKSKKRF
ncbi:NTF2-like domain [Cinara cedri]|uniref:NTF2-like domain n=1 Tax=Cinara cedri TaxID=506608 RepID=A0A5E4NA72_9HEMI|nr:NTF2-like domain [Cinara cedri]